MSRVALGLAEQVAQAGRGRGGVSVVERGVRTSTLRPSGRTEWAWRFEKPTGSLFSNRQSPLARAGRNPFSSCDSASPRMKCWRVSSSRGERWKTGGRESRWSVLHSRFRSVPCISAISLFSFFPQRPHLSEGILTIPTPFFPPSRKKIRRRLHGYNGMLRSLAFFLPRFHSTSFISLFVGQTDRTCIDFFEHERYER